MYVLSHVQKRYARRGQHVDALCDVSLEIEPGEYLALIGASGSGKTTFLSMLGGMLSPDEGQIWIDGASLYECSVAARAVLRRDKIGFVFQTFNLVPYMSAVENVQVPLYLAGMGRREQREQAISLLERLGLGNRLNHKPSEMSIGQQQRVALARTLANSPPVILADEPTGNLDAESRSCVLNFLGELHSEGHTIVVVTHDEVAARAADRRLALVNGSLERGDPHAAQAA